MRSLQSARHFSLRRYWSLLWAEVKKITTKCEHAGLELGISYFKEKFPCNFEPLFVTVSDPNQLIDRKRYLQDNALLQRSLMTVQVQFEPWNNRVNSAINEYLHMHVASDMSTLAISHACGLKISISRQLTPTRPICYAWLKKCEFLQPDTLSKNM